jgi:hypothetical protein
MRNHHGAPTHREKRIRLLQKTLGLSARNEKHRYDCADKGGRFHLNSVDHKVQFEDPDWWKNLPSLKAIGLSCLLHEKNKIVFDGDTKVTPLRKDTTVPSIGSNKNELHFCKAALVDLVCEDRKQMQLRSLAECIGFSTKENEYGKRGDTSPFDEISRLCIINAARLKERLQLDSHERGSEESRFWGKLRADATSVIVRDNRSGAYQLLTIGDPKFVTRCCHEAWQGENSTILPLSSHDRATLLETSDNWRLSDLDVQAFSYAPIPYSFEKVYKTDSKSTFYLLDNDPRSGVILPSQKEKVNSSEWMMSQNQVFLGILGSLIVPRSETQDLLSTLQDAGVRFVYFSPRNMRRQKELASQMGIDVGWNCAISLRPLVKGEEDEHRMISSYADWDVNAKLPHGIESVRRHLKDVDNVPLLVSLFTDATKDTTAEMVCN